MIIHQEAERQFALSKVWQKCQRYEQAIAGYHKTLELDPHLAGAYVCLGNILYEQGRIAEALLVYRQGLGECPNDAALHKGFLNALEEQSGLAACFQSYQLTRQDHKDLQLTGKEIICLTVVRNEKPRLPYFLSFYRALGVDAFFFVDNQSHDSTIEYLLDQKDAYVWQSDLSFNKANFGSAWFEILLRAYGKGHWCLTVDADELLYFPGSETKSIRRLCHQLDGDGKRALKAILLDMYSDKPIRETVYGIGQDFLDACPYFDKQFFHTQFENGGPFKNQTSYFGGVRERVFGQEGQYYLNKVPLLKYDGDMILAGGQHWTNLPPSSISSETGTLLHFKFFSTFLSYVDQESQRQEHYGHGMQYQQYCDGLKKNKSLNLYDKQFSLKFLDSWQLVELGIMTSFYGDEASGVNQDTNGFSPVPSVNILTGRPFWSVLVTVHKRAEYIEQALTSVLGQIAEFQDFQVEVILDGDSDQEQDHIVRKILKIGNGQMGVYKAGTSLGQPGIFNMCLRRAKGHWIHILHDDDWVEHGFYQTLRNGIGQAKDVGAAFCRYAFVTELGKIRRTSWLERETAGIIDNWLERIWVSCRIQTPSIVVNRDVYEKLGGYSDRVGSAWDWDMWKRISVHYPVWFEPKPLACFREHGKAESSHLLLSGKQIRDSRKSIEIAKAYLPKSLGDPLTARAKNNYAMYALNLAKQYLENRQFEAALANLCEGLKCSQSRRVQQDLIRLLVNIEKVNAA